MTEESKNKFTSIFDIAWPSVWGIVIVGALSPVYLKDGQLAEYLRYLYSLICHQMLGRCFLVTNLPILVCARCFGIYSGLFAGWILLLILRPLSLYLIVRGSIILTSALAAPAVIEWLMRFTGIIPAINSVGMATGFLLGAAIAMLIYSLLHGE